MVLCASTVRGHKPRRTSWRRGVEDLLERKRRGHSSGNIETVTLGAHTVKME